MDIECTGFTFLSPITTAGPDMVRLTLSVAGTSHTVTVTKSDLLDFHKFWDRFHEQTGIRFTLKPEVFPKAEADWETAVSQSIRSATRNN